MVTELTPNMLLLLQSSSLEDNRVGLLSIGYDETEESFHELDSLLENPDVIALFRMISTEFMENKGDVKQIKKTLEENLKRDISLENEKIHKNQCKLW